MPARPVSVCLPAGPFLFCLFTALFRTFSAFGGSIETGSNRFLFFFPPNRPLPAWSVPKAADKQLRPLGRFQIETCAKGVRPWLRSFCCFQNIYISPPTFQHPFSVGWYNGLDQTEGGDLFDRDRTPDQAIWRGHRRVRPDPAHRQRADLRLPGPQRGGKVHHHEHHDRLPVRQRRDGPHRRLRHF